MSGDPFACIADLADPDVIRRLGDMPPFFRMARDIGVGAEAGRRVGVHVDVAHDERHEATYIMRTRSGKEARFQRTGGDAEMATRSIALAIRSELWMSRLRRDGEVPWYEMTRRRAQRSERKVRAAAKLRRGW